MRLDKWLYNWTCEEKVSKSFLALGIHTRRQHRYQQTIPRLHISKSVCFSLSCITLHIADYIQEAFIFTTWKRLVGTNVFDSCIIWKLEKRIDCSTHPLSALFIHLFPFACGEKWYQAQLFVESDWYSSINHKDDAGWFSAVIGKYLKLHQQP